VYTYIKKLHEDDIISVLHFKLSCAKTHEISFPITQFDINSVNQNSLFQSQATTRSILTAPFWYCSYQKGRREGPRGIF
jgi:hypothetical protein